MSVVCWEKYGSQPLKVEYVYSGDNKLRIFKQQQRFNSVAQFFRSVFLPQGYPESVSDDYLTYQLWDTLQAFASSIIGILATGALLEALGVGKENATAMAATLTVIMKDGTGMAGRILFAWFQGTNLDCDAKRWRLFADIMNDFAFFLEIFSPFLPSTLFVAVACLSSVCKSIVGVAGGATRAALTQHQARRNNMADVSAKDGSQETLVNLSGLLCGLFLVPVVTGHYRLMWTMYVLLTGLHLFANYSAVRCVVMETLNLNRLHIVTKRWFTSFNQAVLSVKEVNAQEPVIWSVIRSKQLKIGVQVAAVAHSYDELKYLQTVYKNSKYLLNVDNEKKLINIVLHESCDVVDILQSCYQAELIEFVYTSSRANVNTLVQMTGLTADHRIERMYDDAQESNTRALVASSLYFAEATFGTFVKNLELNGWTTSHVLFPVNEWRAIW